MHISKALKLKSGDVVRYPSNRGIQGGTSRIRHVSENPIIQKNMLGHEYIWITLESGGVWPSNRLH